MLETAACADQVGGTSDTSRGPWRRRRDLYAMAEVEELRAKKVDADATWKGLEEAARREKACARPRDAMIVRTVGLVLGSTGQSRGRERLTESIELATNLSET